MKTYSTKQWLALAALFTAGIAAFLLLVSESDNMKVFWVTKLLGIALSVAIWMVCREKKKTGK